MSLKSTMGQRRDGNEKEIVTTLRAVGASVLYMDKSAGFDLLVCWHGQIFVMEVKQRGEHLSDREREVALEVRRQSEYYVIHDKVEALDILGALWVEP